MIEYVAVSMNPDRLARVGSQVKNLQVIRELPSLFSILTRPGF